MTKLYECGTCGVVNAVGKHLCNPHEVESKEVYCGSVAENTEGCDTSKTSEYECGTCGRSSGISELLCNPLKKH